MPFPNLRTSTLTVVVELLVAIVVIGLGADVIWETQDVERGPKQVGVIVGIGLVLVGVWYLVEVIIHRRKPEPQTHSSELVQCSTTDWRNLSIIAIAIVAYALLLQRAGFIFASTVLVVIAAYGLGSQKLVRNAVIAIVLSAVVSVVFDQVLGVSLPDGWLSELM